MGQKLLGILQLFQEVWVFAIFPDHRVTHTTQNFRLWRGQSKLRHRCVQVNNLYEPLQLKKDITAIFVPKTNCIQYFLKMFHHTKKVILPLLTTWNICELPINKVPTLPSIIASVAYKHHTKKGILLISKSAFLSKY